MGNRSDIERVPVDSLKAFYHKHYRPENAMLIVAGRFDEQKALQYVAEHFGPLQNPAEKLATTWTEEPAQDGERSVTLRRVGTSGAVLAAYHIPSAAHPDFAPLAVLTRVLGSEPHGRLYKALVPTKKSPGVTAFAWEMHDPGLLFLGAGVNQGQSADEVRKALLDVTESLATRKITVDEVQHARAELTNGWTSKSSHELADDLREWAGCGDWRLLLLHRDRLNKVTAEDVNRVAAQYLVRSNRTVGEYVPTEQPERAGVPATPVLAELLKDFKGGKPIAPGEEFDPTPENIEKRLRFTTLPSGVKVALLPRKTRGETVSLQLTLHYGNEQSLANLRAACGLLPALMLRGTRGHSYAALDRELTQLDNAGIGANGDIGVMRFGVQCKREHLARVVQILGEILREPMFPEDEFETLKRADIENIRAQMKEPGPLAIQALARKLAPHGKDDLRYVGTHEEIIARLEATTLEQLRQLYGSQVGGANGELVVVGDFDPEQIAQQVDGLLTGWKTTTPYQRLAASANTTVGGGSEVIQTPDKANAVYRAGHMLANRCTDPDYPALVVGNYILGHLGDSRLWVRLREKEGWSYHVDSDYSAGLLDPVAGFEISAICNPINIAKVRAAVSEEIERLLKDGITEAELTAARKAILAERRIFSDAEIVSRLASDLVSGDSFAAYAERTRKMDALTVEEVNAALRKHLQPKKLIIVEAGDFRTAESPR
jgi:zinc protease